MATRKGDPFLASCPSRDILALIGGKWSMLLLCALRNGPARTGALRRKVGGISQKMLTQTLRDLERHGIVQRISHDEVPPRVEYRLTRLGSSLADVVQTLEKWVEDHYPRITRHASQFDLSP